MTDDARARADARLEAALEGSDQRDPRDDYRTVLRHLRQRDDEAFQRALRYFEDEVVPAIAGGADPLVAWAEYGGVLARALGPGRLVDLDTTGRAQDVETLADARGLVLHLPDADDLAAVVLRTPSQPSAAQRASYELLVAGRQTASAYN